MCVIGTIVRTATKPIVVWKWMRKEKDSYVSAWDSRVTDKVLSKGCRNPVRYYLNNTFLNSTSPLNPESEAIGGFCAFKSKENAFCYRRKCKKTVGYCNYLSFLSKSRLRKFFIPKGTKYFHGVVSGNVHGGGCKAICADKLVRGR